VKITEEEGRKERWKEEGGKGFRYFKGFSRQLEEPSNWRAFFSL